MYQGGRYFKKQHFENATRVKLKSGPINVVFSFLETSEHPDSGLFSTALSPNASGGLALGKGQVKYMKML